jgi:hypothetical protein
MDDATKKTQIQEDNFLSVLVASDELSELGPKIRSVLEAGKEKDTLSNLKIFIKAREEEIEKICRNNAYVREAFVLYQLFVIPSGLNTRIKFRTCSVQ